MFISYNNLKHNLRLHGESGAGFTIIEVVLALAILSFGILVIYSAFFTMATSTHDLSLRFNAAYLAKEGAEIIRNIRDTNSVNGSPWADGFLGSPCSDLCSVDYKTEYGYQITPYDNNAFLALNQDGFYSYDVSGTPTLFKRAINIEQISGSDQSLRVTVTVYWDYNNKPFSFEEVDYVYNHR